MKAIIQRALPLTEMYFLIDKKYIPLIESFGTCCDNCGKLISNIATVRSESGNLYNIGFDCLETLLINNNLLDGRDIAEYQKVKKQLPKIIRAAKKLSEIMSNNRHLNITGLLFELPKYETDYYPFYWLKNGEQKSRDNDYIKVTEIDPELMIVTLRNIFPKLNIIAS